jgi:hypothetical protein
MSFEVYSTQTPALGRAFHNFSVKQENLLEASYQRRRLRKVQKWIEARVCCLYSWQ